MKYILSFVVAFISLTLAQGSTAPILTSSLLFNGSGTNVVSSFQTDSAFVVNMTSSAKANLSLFSASTGQKIMNFTEGQIMPYTGEFFFIVHSPDSKTSWQISVENQSYIDSINQARQQAELAASNASSAQNSATQALSNALSFEGIGSNPTSEFYAHTPFKVNFNQDSGLKLFLYSGTNNISEIAPGQLIEFTGQFYIYVNSPDQSTAWRLELTNVN